MEPNGVKLAAGVIIRDQDKLLIVRDRKRWGLPKGGHELRETFKETAKREAKEETGLDVEITDLAFVSEFQKSDWGHYLQFYFFANVVGGTLGADDPDGDILEVKYVPINTFNRYIKFRPIAAPLKEILHNNHPGGHFFINLNKESLEV